jgi:adenine-specific DNA-methyltransferase
MNGKRINYDDWSKEELVKEIKRVTETTYGLVWHRGKETEEKLDILINRDARTPNEMFPNEMGGKPFPVLKEIEGKVIQIEKNKPTNLLIEGDNYHSLAVLNFTHREAIDLIYIDPPYNTGAKDWKYNNDFVDQNDPWRHSKWLSMMDNRLRLAKGLLRKDGSLICAIDDYEINTLGLLLDELFPTLEKNIIIVEHHPQGGGSSAVSRTHEYAYLLTPKGVGLTGRILQEKEDKWSLKRSGQGENNWRKNRPNQFFAIYVDPKTLKIKGLGPSLGVNDKYPTGETKEGYKRIYPIDKNGRERVWRYSHDSMQELIDSGQIICSKSFSLSVQKLARSVTTPIFSVWKGSRYNAGTSGSNLLTEIMGEANTFPYPKSLYTVYDMIAMVIRNKKKAVILDFFAGSGTTGHAVLELNKEDNGERQFILCTNNENNISTEVCYPRIKKVIKGYKNSKGESIAGLGGNLRYFSAYDFVEAKETDQNKRKLVNKSTEMLCIKENAFEVVMIESQFKIFKNSHEYLGILFSEDAIDDYKKAIKKIDGHFNTYVFSLGDDPHEKEFNDVKSKVTLCAIPEVILKVYREIFK